MVHVRVPTISRYTYVYTRVRIAILHYSSSIRTSRTRTPRAGKGTFAISRVSIMEAAAGHPGCPIAEGAVGNVARWPGCAFDLTDPCLPLAWPTDNCERSEAEVQRLGTFAYGHFSPLA
jgi:hypothetical protein